MHIADVTTETDFVKCVLAMAENAPGRLNAEASADGVNESCFTDSRRWQVYSAAKKNSRTGQCLTSETLGAMLPDLRDYASQLWPHVPIYHGYKTLSLKLREYASRRAAFDIGQRIVLAAQTPSEDLGGNLVRAASALQGAYTADGSGIVSGHEVLSSFIDELEAAQTATGNPCVPTGIQAWDEELGGLERGVLTIFGGYPGQRKTGLAATMAGNISLGKVGVGYISLEDRPENIAKRFISRQTGISVRDLTRRRLSKPEQDSLVPAVDIVQRMLAHFCFDGRKGLTGPEVAASARFMVSEKGAKVIVIDLLTEIRPSSGRKERHDLDIGDTVELLRNVASELNVPVVLLAHLSRGADKDSAIYNAPNMFSFSDSSHIERRCKVAVGLYAVRGDEEFTAVRVLKNMNGGGCGRDIYLQNHMTSALIMNVNTRNPLLRGD